MTALDHGNITELFVTNVLGGILGQHKNANGGTVQRLVITSAPNRTPRVLASTKIGAGIPRAGPTRTRSSSARPASASAATAPCTSPTR